MEFQPSTSGGITARISRQAISDSIVRPGEFLTVDACVEATGLKFGDKVTCFVVP